jgi:hypothetical protein
VCGRWRRARRFYPLAAPDLSESICASAVVAAVKQKLKWLVDDDDDDTSEEFLRVEPPTSSLKLEANDDDEEFLRVEFNVDDDDSLDDSLCFSHDDCSGSAYDHPS